MKIQPENQTEGQRLISQNFAIELDDPRCDHAWPNFLLNIAIIAARLRRNREQEDEQRKVA